MNTKKLFTYCFMLLLVLSPVFAYANEDNYNLSVDEVVSKIIQTQSASDLSKIDCTKVSDARWGELGEVIMEVMHPDPKQHELMGQMMGGNGSDNLQILHINMGRNYLGCASGGFGMMNSGIMGSPISRIGTSSNQPTDTGSSMGSYSMTGLPFSGFGMMSGGWVFMILFWLLVILGIVWLIKFLAAKNINDNKGSENEALIILKSRYAKGEINKKEFTKMKKDIR